MDVAGTGTAPGISASGVGGGSDIGATGPAGAPTNHSTALATATTTPLTTPHCAARHEAIGFLKPAADAPILDGSCRSTARNLAETAASPAASSWNLEGG